ncbi:MAG: hypothetical protein AAGI10_04520 [Pseudomonadota bacterium]
MAQITADGIIQRVRASLLDAARHGPGMADHGVLTTDAQALGLIARHIQRTILPRRLNFMADGRCVLSVTAADGRVRTYRLTAAQERRADDADEICKDAVSALKNEKELRIETAAVSAPDARQADGISADDILKSAGLAWPAAVLPDAQSLLQASALAPKIIGFYAPGGPLPDSVPPNLGPWIDTQFDRAELALKVRLSSAANYELILREAPHPDPICLAIFPGREGPRGALIANAKVLEVAAQWSAILATPVPARGPIRAGR